MSSFITPENPAPTVAKHVPKKGVPIVGLVILQMLTGDSGDDFPNNMLYGIVIVFKSQSRGTTSRGREERIGAATRGNQQTAGGDSEPVGETWRPGPCARDLIAPYQRAGEAMGGFRRAWDNQARTSTRLHQPGLVAPDHKRPESSCGKTTFRRSQDQPPYYIFFWR